MVKRIRKRGSDDVASLVAELNATVASLRAENAQLREDLAQLRGDTPPPGGAPPGGTPPTSVDKDSEDDESAGDECDALRAKVAKLSRQLGRNSTNSSSPPSKDIEKRRRRRRKSSRRRGGQPGHVGHYRKPLADEDVTEHVACAIATVCACGHDDVYERGFKTSHTVLGVHGATRYALESGRCSVCRRRRTAALPEGITRSVVGTDLLAAIAHMTGLCGTPRRPTQRFFDDVLGKRLSLGTISHCEAEVGAALAAPMNEAHESALDDDVKHLDETSHRREGKRHTAWVLSTLLVTVMFLGLRRSAASLKAILKGALRGTAVTDRYAVYERFGLKRQLCLEHIRRNFLGLVEVGGVVGEVSLRCTSAVRRVLVAWREKRARKIDDKTYRKIVARCRRRIETELARGWQLDPELRTLAYAFIVQPEIVWRFVDDNTVPPTNNQGERDIRDLVVRRKVQLHTWSERGDRYVERTLTVGGTCRKQKRNPYAFIVDALDASRRGQPSPRLLAAV